MSQTNKKSKGATGLQMLLPALLLAQPAMASVRSASVSRSRSGRQHAVITGTMATPEQAAAPKTSPFAAFGGMESQRQALPSGPADAMAFLRRQGLLLQGDTRHAAALSGQYLDDPLGRKTFAVSPDGLNTNKTKFDVSSLTSFFKVVTTCAVGAQQTRLFVFIQTVTHNTATCHDNGTFQATTDIRVANGQCVVALRECLYGVANSAPTNISLTSTSVNQSLGVNATVGTLSTTDADSGDSHTYSLVAGTGDTDNASFNISGSTLRANDASALAAGSYSVRINTNDGTADYAKALTITVVDNLWPTYQNGTPSLSGTTQTQTTLTTRLNETGVTYWVVLASGADAPFASHIRNGTDRYGLPAPFSGNYNVTSAGVDFSDTITGLSPGTSYDIWVMSEDNIPNLGTTNQLVLTTAAVDADGSLTAGGGVSEPVALNTTVDTVGEAVNLFDFTLTDGSGGDTLPMTVSQVVVNVSGTSTDSERGQVTWRLNGNDASNVAGVYDAGADTITFSGLSISVADGGSETYTINAYYNDNTNLTENHTFILSVDGDTDLTLGAGGTQMSTTSPITNSTGSTIGVTATALAFTTQPAGSVSGSNLTTQPVVTAQDAFGNTDLDFTETITLTEASAGTLTGTNALAAVSGVATFTDLVYGATADQQSFTLTANDQDGVGSDLSTVDANAVTSDVVATKLLFTTQPSPLTVTSGIQTSFSTVPVVKAVDADNLVDTGYSTGIALSEVNGAGSAIMTGTGDTDANGATVTLIPSSGVAAYTGLSVTYTASGSSDESFNLQASSGGLSTANTSQLTAEVMGITDATYNASTGVLLVTGTHFTANGGGADIDASKLTLTGESGATYTLTDTSDVEIDSATQFTITLSANDKPHVDGLLNKDGTQSDGGTNYNLAAADDYLTAVTAGDTSDATNGITVSNVAAPTVTSAGYDASTGVLTVTGTNLVHATGAGNDIDASLLTLTGEGGSTYTLTDTADVEIGSVTSFTLTLSATDKAAINLILNKDGNSSTGATNYNLAAADDWQPGAAASSNIADLTNNDITVSNVAVPTIDSATYDANTGALVVTGTDFTKLAGAGNDIVANKFSFTGEGGATHTLTDTANVEITSGTAFTLMLSASDKAAINQLANKNGTDSTGGTGYNLAAAEDWAAGADSGVTVADLTGNGVTVANVATPTITGAGYNAATGVLTVSGSNFSQASGATNDIVANKFTLTGEGGATYSLTDTANVDINSATGFSLALSATDMAAVNQIINKNGDTSTGGTSYNLAAAEDWAAGADSTVTVADLTGNGITANSVAAPTVTGASYDYANNLLTVTGTGLLKRSGAGNDIDVSMLTLTGEGGATYTLASSSDVEITSGTGFTVTLSGADIYRVEALLNQNGASAASGTNYNLAAFEDWNTGADSAVTIADLTDNGITVSNYTTPTVTSATYDWNSGQLVITGTELVSLAGAGNDIDASLLSISGQDGSYSLTDSSDVELVSATSATVTLSATDKLNVHGLLNKNGTASSGPNPNIVTYNLAAMDNWVAGSPLAVDIADLTGNGITTSNVCTPSITGSSYDADTGVVTVTGSCLFKKPGANNDIDLSTFTFTGGVANATYTLTTTNDVEISSDTGFSFTLSATDKTNVDALLDQLGSSSSGGSTYNIAAAEDWLTAADAAATIADAGNGVNVTVNPQITSAGYNPATGVLVVTGSNLQANAGGADIDASMLTLTGEAGGSYTLTDTSDVERDSLSQFTLILSATDKAAVNALLNNTGTQSDDATPYNLAAADDWNTNITAGDTSDALATVTVSNTAPILTQLDGDAVSYSIGGADVLLDNGSDATLDDLSSQRFDGGSVTVSITANAQTAEDLLKIGNGAISTSGSDVMHSDSGGTIIGSFSGGSSGTDLVISLNSDATLARVRDLLSALKYANSDTVTTNTLSRSVRILINDGDGANAANQDVTVALVRAPIIDLDGDDSSGAGNGSYSGVFTEQAGAVAAADTDNSISDDGASYKALQVTLSNRPDAASESLSSSYGTGAQNVNAEAVTIGAYNSATGVLDIVIDDTSTSAATMQLLIASIRYDNSAEEPDSTSRIISFAATDTDDNLGPVASSTLSVTRVNDAPTGSVTISGSAIEDQTLTAANSLADNDGLGAISYQWQRNGGNIAGATGGSYLLTDSDVGTVISVVASYTDGQGTAESVTSSSTAAVANVNDAPTGSVTISGQPIRAQTLTAANTLADADGLGAIGYQWQRNGSNISGATAATYVLVTADIGTAISVVASYTDGHGTAESVTSGSTALVENNNTAPILSAGALSLAEDDSASAVITVTDETPAQVALSITTPPAHGSAELNGSLLTYVPTANYNGSDSLTLVGDDGEFLSAPLTIAITVTPVNDAPVANDDSFTLPATNDNSYSLAVLANDSDVDTGDTLSISSAKAEIGSVTIAGQQLLYSAPANLHSAVTLG
ncbi:cadherin-like domain-containing protein, partial [Shewanella sp. AS16]|uniref:Ig-like domain-containing protein n=1 Tax=Shewanella sp. AS16 TaxID=2907625 RepID=UPI001F449299